ncbi:G2/mitotic-specific cyclin-2-like [Salvia splendens]|uniref:G2/mitotic-specific cyclin-2-like n=1 Tax=Salvia splendens TaxID=180675 RepID=UPI0011044538|nr:G2/mitotic-specific cyclin-2-like [Salvia splendens]
MEGQSENFRGVIRQSNNHGGMKVTAQAGNRRKALSTIDSNVIGINKRGVLKEKNGIFQKNPVAPLHRPVTRKFAAQLAVKEKQQVKPSIQHAAEHKSSDCIIIDTETSEDNDMLMYVQHTEAMLVEIDRMDAEVEMEDLDLDEPIVDIDDCDKKNPLAVTEYIDDIYAYYKKTESSSCLPSNYMAQQFDINDRMRGILIDWLIEVHYKFGLMDETLYLTVNLIDRFLAIQSVERKRLQLVGITALLLACKYEEVSVPVVEDLVLISDNAYSRKEVLNMEKSIVNTLQFNMSLPTPYVFMRRFLKAAQSDRKLELVSFYILELSLVQYEMLRFPPSLLASAAIFTAQCTLTQCETWSRTCGKHTSYSKDELMECARLMVTLHQNAGNGKLTGVYKKYSTSKYGYAAKIKAAVFLKEAK